MNKFKPRRPFSLYRDDPNIVSKDTELIDRLVREHIQMGGVVVYAYRYLGTPTQQRNFVNERTDPGIAEPVDIGSFLGIEDPLWGENRDRIYDFNDIPRLHGVFKVSQNDMLYGRYGPQGLNNDVYSIEFHTRTVESASGLGRRFIVGDVLEFPHLKDISVDGRVAPKLYQVVRVMKSPTAWDQHYVNHVLGLVLMPVRDQQEFTQFMERTDKYGKTMADQVSTGSNILALNDALAEQAEKLVPSTIWDTTRLYYDPTDKKKRPNFWVDDGQPPNGLPVQSGTEFPLNPDEFDYFLRTDFAPNRLYQFYDNHWQITEIDHQLQWQPYAWVKEFQQFLASAQDTDINNSA